MKKNTVFAILIMLSLASLFVITTETSSGKKEYIRDGKEYGVVKGLFKGKWWHYFERGLSFADGGFWEEAESDLRKAIKKRNKDKRRARKYGVHYVEYFPHRELGIAYYYQKKYKIAEDELLLSLSHEESAKSKYYLNKVRKSIIEQDKSDLSPPDIFITSPGKGAIVTGLDMTITGTSLDDKFVSSVTINGKPVFIETANKKINFSQKVRLKPGQNNVVVTATDLTGKTVSKNIPITVDRQAPLLIIESIIQKEKDSYTINGMVTDKNGVAGLNIGGEIIPVTNKNEIKFSHTVSGEEGTVIAFKAIDISGNTTEGTIPLVLTRKAATAPLPVEKGPETSQPGTKLPMAVTKDTTSPFIKLKKGIKKEQTVFSGSFFLEGIVKDTGGVTSLSINGRPIEIRHGVRLHFNYLAELNTGTNNFEIIATDKAGNSSKKTIIVERKIPETDRISSRLATAILPFQVKGGKGTITSIFPDLFLQALVDKKRFNIVERAVLEAKMAKHKLSSTDLADKSKAQRVGKYVSAELVISGTILETSKFVQIYARAIDTETSEILMSTDVYGENKDAESIDYLIGGLAWKIVKRFPIIKGTIVKIDKKNVYLSYAEEGLVRKNMKFIIYRHVKTDNGADGPVDNVEMLCEAKVFAAVSPNISKMEIVRKLEDKPIYVNDLAISK